MVYYDELLVCCHSGENNFVEELSLLDATKDCITGNEDGMNEWTISPKGKLRFQ